jgi:mannose/cellobiose epimerase-like protein (N-acyl-D-glucosamine 2-epimerase family)
MKHLSQSLTLMGKIENIDLASDSFDLRCQSGDLFTVYTKVTTNFQVIKNLDNLDYDRIVPPLGYDSSKLVDRIKKYVKIGELVVVEGIYMTNEGASRFDGRLVHILTSGRIGGYLFEETQWWLTQTARLADQWLDSLFHDKRNYQLDDFTALYRTDLNIQGLPTDDDTQECAVLSRLIYGLSSAYLLTGQDRYRKAAEAGVKFQRDSFRSLSHDGKYCFWAYGRRRTKYGTQLLVPSDNPDDKGSLALYEQIYALAGQTLYYRISLDPDILEDITRTLSTFKDFYLDVRREDDSEIFSGKDGWFSHIDYATLRPNRNPNPINDMRKNWNSVGDHIPAYLINLILAIDPLPVGGESKFSELLALCHDMLKRSTELILDKFPDKDEKIPYVNERFDANWNPDHEYSWQMNRAIVGHNFKIAWNLSRVAAYYEGVIESAASKQQKQPELAKRCRELADRIGRNMIEVGFDQIRGGCFDAVEREPKNGQPIDFAWMNTKDFWQQEQAILACLILYGHSGDQLYLDMARRAEGFWNVFFLDHDNRGMYFRVNDNGVPIIDSTYGVRGGHADASGYHCFELSFLAHIYNRCYVGLSAGTDSSFCLYFRTEPKSRTRSINVLPDFIGSVNVRIKRVMIGGEDRKVRDPHNFQIELTEEDIGAEIVVEFAVSKPGSKTVEYENRTAVGASKGGNA